VEAFTRRWYHLSRTATAEGAGQMDMNQRSLAMLRLMWQWHRNASKLGLSHTQIQRMMLRLLGG
jgi:hypothetical protein